MTNYFWPKHVALFLLSLMLLLTATVIWMSREFLWCSPRQITNFSFR